MKLLSDLEPDPRGPGMSDPGTKLLITDLDSGYWIRDPDPGLSKSDHKK